MEQLWWKVTDLQVEDRLENSKEKDLSNTR